MDKDTLQDIIALINNDYHCRECIGWVQHWCVSCSAKQREKAIIDMLKQLMKECENNGKSGNIS